jgi:hypothetical protein
MRSHTPTHMRSRTRTRAHSSHTFIPAHRHLRAERCMCTHTYTLTLTHTCTYTCTHTLIEARERAAARTLAPSSRARATPLSHSHTHLLTHWLRCTLALSSLRASLPAPRTHTRLPLFCTLLARRTCGHPTTEPRTLLARSHPHTLPLPATRSHTPTCILACVLLALAH